MFWLHRGDQDRISEGYEQTLGDSRKLFEFQR